MKKYIVAGVIGVLGIILGVAVKGVGWLLALILIALAILIALGKIAFVNRLTDQHADEAGGQSVAFCPEDGGVHAHGHGEGQRR